ncbi:MAG: tetratricopeptide repeat protein [Candidatus Sericytochromatia bacterium]
MNGLMLACMRGALGLAVVAGLGQAPAIAQADPWPGIRADYREGAFDQALAGLARLLEANPDDREALYYTAIIQWRLEHYPEAARAYRRVLALDPHGPFGQDAETWLAAYGHLAPAPPSPIPAPPTPVPVAVSARPTPKPTPRATPKPQPRPTAKPQPRPTAPPRAKASILPIEALRPHGAATVAPWLQAQPQGKNKRPRSANARPGYFKGADGSFEFIPPSGFVLLDEGTQGLELSTLFGLPRTAATAEAPATLLITWREFEELKALNASQRAARERQLLMMEASMYGPGAQLEGRYGGPCYRVRQAQGAWAADTILFFQHRKLYALTFGGAASELEKHRAQVEKSLGTPIFYP